MTGEQNKKRFSEESFESSCGWSSTQERKIDCNLQDVQFDSQINFQRLPREIRWNNHKSKISLTLSQDKLYYGVWLDEAKELKKMFDILCSVTF